MNMDKPPFHTEIVRVGQTSLVRMVFERQSNQYANLQVAIEAFDRHLAEGRSSFLFDLQQIPFPSTSFIAFVIAASVRARAARGEVKLTNLSTSAKNNLITFSALTYLTVEDHASEPAWSQPERDLDSPPAAEPKFVESPVLSNAVEEALESPRYGNIATREEEEPASRHTLKVESASSNLYRLCDFVTEHAQLAGMDEREIGKIKIAVYEACLNVIEHAYHSNPNHFITLTVSYTPNQFTIAIEDQGLAFELPSTKAYDVLAAMEDRRTGGFGLHIIRRATDHVDYKSDPVKGNRLTMMKRLR